MEQDMITCAVCKKRGPVMAFVYVWIRTLCSKCAEKKLISHKGMI